MRHATQPVRYTLAALLIGLAGLGVSSSHSSAKEGVWPVKQRLIGKDAEKSEDIISGIACTTSSGFPRACMVIDDNMQGAQFVTVDDGALRAGEVVPLIRNRLDNKMLELDGEGIAYADGAFYVIGSHGHPRDKKHKLDPVAQKDVIEARIAASSQVVRVRLKPTAGAALSQDDVAEVRGSTRLREIIARQPVLKRFMDRRLENNGVTIEGIAILGSRLFAGFRGSNSRRWTRAHLVCRS